MFMCCAVVLELVEGSQLLPSTVANIVFLGKKSLIRFNLSLMLIHVVCFRYNGLKFKAFLTQ